MDREEAPGRAGFQAWALPLFLVAMTLATVGVFLGRVWWLPEAITAFGEKVDRQFLRTLVVCGVIFLLAQIGLALVVWRSADRGRAARHSHGNNRLEVLWTTATAVLFLGLGALAGGAWASLHFTGAKPGAMQVEVTGQQFAWNFRYPGPDGRFGRTDPSLISDSGGNPLGLDHEDAAAADDLVLPTMAVPVDREVELILRAKDVTHSFFVRELRFKQDLVPGMQVRVHFTPTRVGKYEIACAELCGLGHHRMRSFLEVLEPDEYENWLRERAE